MKKKVKEQGAAFSGFTDFEKRVLKCVMNIPFAEVRSYKWVAEHIGEPKAVRAVGNAVKRNPFPCVIPCHRVVKSNGCVGNYSLGNDMKINLINLEKNIKDMIK